MNNAQAIINFYRELSCPTLPTEIQPLLPFKNPEVLGLMHSFYNKFYNDKKERTMLLGINPGRLGAGLTGIGFTDPLRLKEHCGVDNTLDRRAELSSVFVYEVIEQWGGVENFFSKFLISSVCPIGFTCKNKNINYYDRPDLLTATNDFILNCLTEQLEMPINKKIAFSIGNGKNFKILDQLNKEHNFFNRIVALPHPRWVMQYNLKEKQRYIELYLKALEGK